MIIQINVDRNSLWENGSRENNENPSQINISATKTDLVVKGNKCCY